MRTATNRRPIGRKEDQRKIEDELSKIQIDQLHRATLNFSNNSLETKKLCVTVETSALTLVELLYKEQPFEDRMAVFMTFGILIPILFYFVDVFLYYYQDKLRAEMTKESNKIRERHEITFSEKKRSPRLLRSLFNGSQLIYAALILMVIISPRLFHVLRSLMNRKGIFGG